MRSRLMSLLAVAALAACASGPEPSAVAEQAQQCSVEMRTGSSIPVTRCQSVGQKGQDQAAAVEVADRIRRSAPPAPVGVTGN